MVIVKCRNNQFHHHHSDVHHVAMHSKAGEGEEHVPTVGVGKSFCGEKKRSAGKSQAQAQARGVGKCQSNRQEQRRHASDSPTMRARRRGGSARSQERVLPQAEQPSAGGCTTKSSGLTSGSTTTVSVAQPRSVSKKKKDRKQAKSDAPATDTTTAKPNTSPKQQPDAKSKPSSTTASTTASALALASAHAKKPIVAPQRSYQNGRRYYKKKWNHNHSNNFSQQQHHHHSRHNQNTQPVGYVAKHELDKRNDSKSSQVNATPLSKKPHDAKSMKKDPTTPTASITTNPSATAPPTSKPLDKKKKPFTVQNQAKSPASIASSKKKHAGDKSLASQSQSQSQSQSRNNHEEKDETNTSKKAAVASTKTDADAKKKGKDMPTSAKKTVLNKDKSKYSATTGSSSAGSSWKEKKKHYKSKQKKTAAHHAKQSVGSSSTHTSVINRTKTNNNREDKVVSPMTVGSSASAPRGAASKAAKQQQQQQPEASTPLKERNKLYSEKHEEESTAHDAASTASSCVNRVSSPVPITSVVTNEAGAAILRSISGAISHVESTSSSVSSLPLPPCAGGGYVPSDAMYASCNSSLSMHHPLSPAASLGGYPHGVAHHNPFFASQYQNQQVYGQHVHLQPPPQAGVYPMHYPMPLEGPPPQQMYGGGGASAGVPVPGMAGVMVMPSAPEGFYYLAPSSGVAIPFDGDPSAGGAGHSMMHSYHLPPMEQGGYGDVPCGEYGSTAPNATMDEQAPNVQKVQKLKHLNAEAKEFQPRNR